MTKSRWWTVPCSSGSNVYKKDVLVLVRSLKPTANFLKTVKSSYIYEAQEFIPSTKEVCDKLTSDKPWQNCLAAT